MLLISAVSIVGASHGFCQVAGNVRTVRYQGIILDSLSNEPLKYAHAYIAGTFIGTVANSLGEFQLVVPDSVGTPFLSVSHLGYRSITRKLQWDSSNVILLRPSPYELEEITISNGFDSAGYILDNAVRLISFNYPRKLHQLEGFFREISLKDTSYSRLVEAAVLIQEVGYQVNTYNDESLALERNRVKVIELRKSDSFRESNLSSKILTALFGDRNELYSLLDNNFVRILGKKSNHSLSRKGIKNFDVEYIDRTEWENESVYVLELRQYEATSPQWPRFKFYIRKKDFGIVKIEWEALVNPNLGGKQWAIDGKFWATSQIVYRKINNKYFPVFIQARHQAPGAGLVVKEGSILNQHVETMFLLTNVYDDISQKVRWRDAEKRDKNLYESNTQFNEEFWSNYNMVKLTPLIRGTQEIEKNRPLSEQFKTN
jgi:hypothetical protein